MNTETLRPLLEDAGPFASVWLDVSQDTENGAAALEVRRRDLRDRLAALGAGDDLVQAVDEAVRAGGPAVGRAGRALVATTRHVVATQTDEPPADLQARVSDLPYVLPVLRRSTPLVPHVLVVVDRTGADLKAVDRAGEVHQPHPVAGADEPLHKVRAGGWSHYSIQNRVEEQVHRTMKLVAAAVGQLAERVGARAVLVAGEVQARTALAAALAPHVVDQVVQLESGGRAAGTEPQAIEAEAQAVLDRIAAEDHDAQLDRFRVEGEGLAVQGMAAAVEALREANAELVLVADALPADRPMWTGDAPNLLALDKKDLVGLAGEPTEHRVDEAVPSAAVAVGAQLVPVADEITLQDGIGVLRRHT